MTQLTAFLAVVRGGSVTAAADELVVTQPSVSSAIAALGRELGCDLFERAGRGIRLTDAGHAFKPYAEDVVGLLDDGRQAAREAADVAARRMRIAAVTTAAESFVPPLMRAFTARHPDVELTLDVGNREYVFERVLSHLADVAISGKPPADERLVAEPLLENHIACITGPDDPLAAAGRSRRASSRIARGCCASPARARARWASSSSRTVVCARTRSRSDPTARSSRPPAPVSASRCCRAPRSRPSWRRAGWARSR